MTLGVSASPEKLIIIVTHLFFDIIECMEKYGDTVSRMHVIKTCDHESCIQDKINDMYAHLKEMHPDIEMELVNKSDLTLTNPGDKVANDLLKQFSMN